MSRVTLAASVAAADPFQRTPNVSLDESGSNVAFLARHAPLATRDGTHARQVIDTLLPLRYGISLLRQDADGATLPRWHYESPLWVARVMRRAA